MCRSRLCIILRFSFISAVLYIGCEGLLRRIFFSSLLMFHERVYTWKCRNSSSQTACNCGSTSSFSICVGLFWRQRRQMLTYLTHSCRTGFLFSTIPMLLQAIRARVRAEMRMLGHVWEEYHACTTDTLQNGRMEQLEKRLDFSPFLWFIFVLFHIIRATVTEQRTNSSCFEVDGRRGGKYKNAQHKFRLQLFIHLYFAPFLLLLLSSLAVVVFILSYRIPWNIHGVHDCDVCRSWLWCVWWSGAKYTRDYRHNVTLKIKSNLIASLGTNIDTWYAWTQNVELDFGINKDFNFIQYESFV